MDVLQKGARDPQEVEETPVTSDSIIIIIIIIITIITLLSIMYNNCMDDVINIVTRTQPATYVYGIYRHAHSARNVCIWDLSSRALCPPRTYMGFIVTRQAME